MSMIQGIDHVVLIVRDVERSAAWYRDRLGLEPARLEEFRRGETPFASMRISAAQVIDLLPGEPSGKNIDHVALVLDPSVNLEKLVASGDFEVRAGPMRIWGAQGYGMGLYVADPDGHVIELKSYRAG
jgi:catechol 2,3-dioxygenase-like lactoylglutathione lyase family enzyme